MQENWLESLLHIPCKVTSYEGISHLPLYLRGNYEFYRVEIEQITFLAAHPVEDIPLPTLRKHWAALVKQSNFPCAFFFDTLTLYKKEKLLEYGIPFVSGKTDVFLPFLGVVLSKQARKLPECVSQCSMMTQKFLLTAIYQRVSAANAAEIADLMQVSRMSGTRCMDEIEVLFPMLVQRNGRRRVFAWNGEWNAYWERIQPKLRNPVIREYRLDTASTFDLPLSGLSAISHYSMLDSGSTCIYGTTKAMETQLQLAKQPQVPSGEIPNVVIQILGYEIPFQDAAAIDPLSAILTLQEEEQEDPRVEGAIQEIKEKYLL